VIPFSVPDLSPINKGSDAAQAFRNSLDLAQHAEPWNYNRFWLAEHHNMPRHRQRCDRGGDRLYRRRRQDHSCWIGRRDVTKPCAVGHRRAIRYAGIALPGPHRSRARPRTRHRSADRARVAPGSGHDR
jgi:hypothetical protein